jgi:hypothetical protein
MYIFLPTSPAKYLVAQLFPYWYTPIQPSSISWSPSLVSYRHTPDQLSFVHIDTCHTSPVRQTSAMFIPGNATLSRVVSHRLSVFYLTSAHCSPAISHICPCQVKQASVLPMCSPVWSPQFQSFWITPSLVGTTQLCLVSYLANQPKFIFA